MRLLLPVHAFADGPRSGLHTVIWNTARELARRGHEVHVVATYVELSGETPASLRAQGIHLHHVAQFNMHNLSKPLALRCFLTTLWLRCRMRFDWIYIIDTARTPFSTFKLGARLATRALAPDTPEIRTLFETGDWAYDRERKDEEEGWERRPKPLWYRAFSALADRWFAVTGNDSHLKNVDLLFCQGEDTLAYWRARFTVPMIALPNGVEATLFDGTHPRPREPGRFVFLFTGRLGRRKGLFRLLTVFGRLRQGRDDIELWIVGKGSKALTKEVTEAAALDPAHIRLFGELPRREVPSVMLACDALVDPMIYQGWSSVAMEAQYCGKPVVVSRFGGSKDYVVDGQTGFVIDPRDEGALEGAMRALADDPKRASLLGAAGRQRIRDRFLWKHAGDILEQAFLQPRA